MNLDEAYRSVSTWLKRCHRPLVLSHQRPDGDSLGAMAAMVHVLERYGCRPVPMLFEPPPPAYRVLRDCAQWPIWSQHADEILGQCDAVVIVDTCALAQLEPAVEYLRDAPPTLVIDHHATRDAIGVRPGDLRVLDETAAAVCVLIAEWMRGAPVAFDEKVAAALFVGIATDCGWFRFSNTDDRTLRVAAELVRHGAAPAHLYDAIYQQDAPARVRLIGRMLSRLELHAGGKLAVLTLRPADFEAVGADPSMAYDLVNEAGRLGCTEATLLFTQQPDGTIRVNLRSKRVLDVAALARRYGGGGHARAAGATLRGEWDVVVPRLIQETCDLLH